MPNVCLTAYGPPLYQLRAESSMTEHYYDHTAEANPPGPSGAPNAAVTASVAGPQAGLSKALKTGTAKVA